MKAIKILSNFLKRSKLDWTRDRLFYPVFLHLLDFLIFRDHLGWPNAPTCGLVEPVFCVQKNWKQCVWNGWNGWTWTMAGGEGSHHQIWRLNDWIWLKRALGTCCHFLFQSFKRGFLGQLKSLEPVHFGSIHVSELIWNQIYVRYMAAGFSSNFCRDTSNQVHILW